jgi:hypothetical protein
MRAILLLSLFAACDLKPSPPTQAAPPPPPTGSGSGSGSGSATPRAVPRPTAPDVQPTPECEQAAIKYADLTIASADASQKPAFEIERTKIIRSTELACTQQQWPRAALACIAQSATDTQARACLDKFPPPAAATGSGSADHPTVHTGPS